MLGINRTMDELIQSLINETKTFCNEAAVLPKHGVKVLTKEEIEEDDLDLTEIILDTDKTIDPVKRNLVDVINKAINDEATLSDIIEVVLDTKKKVAEEKKRLEKEGK